MLPILEPQNVVTKSVHCESTECVIGIVGTANSSHRLSLLPLFALAGNPLRWVQQNVPAYALGRGSEGE
jgi:hypothetical protein